MYVCLTNLPEQAPPEVDLTSVVDYAVVTGRFVCTRRRQWLDRSISDSGAVSWSQQRRRRKPGPSHWVFWLVFRDWLQCGAVTGGILNDNGGEISTCTQTLFVN